MYRNSNDKRVKQSAEQLFQAIQTLLAEKRFDQIGIKEVSEVARIGRATFYRNFDYVEDILRLKLDQSFDLLKQQIDLQIESRKTEVAIFFQFWVEHPTVLEVLIKANRWDIFAVRFNEGAEIKLMEITESMELSDGHHLYLNASIRAMFSAVLQTWVERGRLESPEELVNVFKLPFKVFNTRQQMLHNQQTSH